MAEDLNKIPIFPLSIFPLPGELVPLHIFESRYKQLLQDCETKDIFFGIYYTHTTNDRKLGSLMKLESIIKRYHTGESDIIVKCVDLFEMTRLFRNYKDKLYPGGEVRYFNIDYKIPLGNIALQDYFQQYLDLMKLNTQPKEYSQFEIANELSLDNDQKLRLVNMDESRKNQFLLSLTKFQLQLLQKVDMAKDVFHLN